MKYLETVLSFILSLAKVLAGRKKKKEPDDCRCGFPDDNQYPVVEDEGDGGYISSDRRNPNPIRKERDEINPVNFMGWCLILAAGVSRILG